MKICYFGIYDPDYSRNRVLLSGFKANGVEIVECRIDPRANRGLSKYLKLFQSAWKLRNESFSFVLVAFPGQGVVWIARLIFRVPIVFDAFLSLYDSNVYDRKLYSPYSPQAWKDYALDWLSIHLAQIVLLDTNQHIHYFASMFGLAQEKYIRVFVGTDTNLFQPQKNQRQLGPIRIHFHGHFIPLQGVEYIVEAAALLKDEPIIFSLIGQGQEYQKIVSLIAEKKLTAITLEPEQSLQELAESIARTDICLGIFGSTSKTGRVIPNKIYEYAASGKPIITADTSAIRELFENGQTVLLCRQSDPADLAEMIRKLAHDSDLRMKLGAQARALAETRFTPALLVAELIAHLPASFSL